MSFSSHEINYLGHIVSKNGIETDPKKIEAIQNWPRSKTVHDVQSFLGFTNYYRKFLYKYAQKAHPLNQLISGENAKKKYRKVKWNDVHEQAFQLLKAACIDTPVGSTSSSYVTSSCGVIPPWYTLTARTLNNLF